MTYYGGKQLADAFRTVRKNTAQIARDIPEDQYDFKAAPDTRSVRDTLVHIALGPTFAAYVHQNRISDMTKVNFQDLVTKITAEQEKPRSKAEIVALLETEGETFASYMAELSDEFLAETVTVMPGGDPETAKSRFELLLGVKEHEMHHRAQLMVLERMIGIVPHLTRQMQERMAQWRAAQAAQAQETNQAEAV
jgi:uncharacterized damage-inducible protein DinB